MTNVSYFLKDIETEGYMESLDYEDYRSVKNYLADINSHGPFNGDMDIDWQCEGRSYYLHDHILYSIKNEEERKQYLIELSVDTEEWLKRAPNHYVVNRIKEMYAEEFLLLQQHS